MNAKEKCISKWERRRERLLTMDLRYGSSVWNNYKEKMKVIEEFLSDLKRIK